jgi:hypothetical protein
MQKPNAILHMTGYGLIYGLLLAMLYIWGFFLVTSLGAEMAWQELLSMVMSTGYFAFIFGGLPGAVLGLVEGWMLWYLTRSIQLPLLEAEIATRRKVALGVMGGITFVSMAGLLAFLFGFLTFLIIAPPFIAAFAAMYAVHRYFLKLRAWGNIGKAKNKAKHSLTNQLADEAAAPSEQVLADEIQQDIANTRR